MRLSAAVSGSRRGEYGLSYWNDDDLSSLVVDVERQMARFVAKTLRVCSRLLVLTYWSWGQRLFLCHRRGEL